LKFLTSAIEAIIVDRSKIGWRVSLDSLAPRPLIQRVYRLQYNAILKAIRTGIGLGLGPRLVSRLLTSYSDGGLNGPFSVNCILPSKWLVY